MLLGVCECPGFELGKLNIPYYNIITSIFFSIIPILLQIPRDPYSSGLKLQQQIAAEGGVGE